MGRRLLLLCAWVVHAHVLELVLDGTQRELRFEDGDDVDAVARAFAASYPALGGMDCADGDERCVVGVLGEAMRNTVRARAAGARALAAAQSGIADCVADGPGGERVAGVLAALEAAAVRGAALAYVAEQVAGFCMCAADRRAASVTAAFPSGSGARANGTAAAARAGRVAVAAAALSLELEPRRVRAARFGMLAAAEVGDAGSAALFGRRFAELKWPRGEPDHVLGGDIDLPWTMAPPIAWSPTLPEARDMLQMGLIHSTMAEFLRDQLRWLVEEDLGAASCAGAPDLAAAADGLDAIAKAAGRRRRALFGDGGDAAAYARVADTGEVHANVGALIAAEPDAAARASMAAGQAALGRALCVVAGAPVAGGALALGDEAAAAAEAEFADRGVAVVDGLLRAEAVAGLRAFLRGSTVFTRAYAQGYLGAFLGDGFGASAVANQVAADLKRRFPALLGDASLRQAWAYAYPRELHPRGIDIHSDDADVSVNVWLTADESNAARDGRLGGLRVYERLPPEDWDFSKANRDLEAITELLGDDAVDRIPYRFNRAVILNGHRFHQTDGLDFKPGFKNHRINLTFLFRVRTLDAACAI